MGRLAAEAGQRAISPALGKAGFQTGRKQAGRGDRAQTIKPCGCDLPAPLPARAPCLEALDPPCHTLIRPWHQDTEVNSQWGLLPQESCKLRDFLVTQELGVTSCIPRRGPGPQATWRGSRRCEGLAA